MSSQETVRERISEHQEQSALASDLQIVVQIARQIIWNAVLVTTTSCWTLLLNNAPPYQILVRARVLALARVLARVLARMEAIPVTDFKVDAPSSSIVLPAVLGSVGGLILLVVIALVIKMVCLKKAALTAVKPILSASSPEKPLPA